MNKHARNLKKPSAFCAISNITLETVDVVDHLTLDGRSELLDVLPEQPGGQCCYAVKAIQSFDLDADVMAASLIGAIDQAQTAEAARTHGVDPRHLLPVEKKATNRTSVILGPGDEKLIIRRKHAVSFEADLNTERRRHLQGLIAQSRACLLGNMHVTQTEHFLDFGKLVGTYMCLGAGGKQLGHLARLKPYGLFLNSVEAQEATGCHGEDPARVFESLLAVTRAEHVVVMTGGGRQPTFVAERLTGQVWTLPPVQLRSIPERNGHLNTLGAGDTLAGVVSFLLGMPRTLLTGECVLEAVRFGQEAAIAHVTGSAWARKRVRARYQEIRALFEPKKPEAAKDQEAA